MVTIWNKLWVDLEGGVTFRCRYGFIGRLVLRPGWLLLTRFDYEALVMNTVQRYRDSVIGQW